MIINNYINKQKKKLINLCLHNNLIFKNKIMIWKQNNKKYNKNKNFQN